MRVLLTGAAGFAGLAIAEELVARGHEVVALDALTYAARLDRLANLRVAWLHHDVRQPWPDVKAGAIVHNAAESHVLRSLEDPALFVETNVLGTLNGLELARKNRSRFIYTSTDEVFGPSTGTEGFKEDARFLPSSPYAASKAAGEHLVRGYFRSFGLPAIITRTCNMFGPWQHAEKFVPKALGQILRHETVDIYPGSRTWCPVGDQARAITWLVDNGTPGRAYHVAKGQQLDNLAMARLLAKLAGEKLLFEAKPSNRPGYDEAYALAESPEAKFWRDTVSFEKRLEETVAWYKERL